MKSKLKTSSMPRLFKVSTTLARLALCTSGIVVGSKSLTLYSLKHFPGPVLPDRPARCSAEAFEMGVSRSDSIPVFGLYELILQYPGSTTYLIPSMVNDVSAILVARTTFRVPLGAGSNTFACSSVGRFE